MSASDPAPRHTHVAIIGTGFGGLGAAIRLKREGGCSSWYLDRTARNSTLWPDSSWRYYRRASRFVPAEYTRAPVVGAAIDVA